jgi:RHS repeat-associated protein
VVNGTLVQGWLYQDQLRPVAQLDGTGTNVVAQFVYGSKPNVPDYMVTSGGTYRILSDHLGSPRAVVDVASGNLIETINFDEFGNESDVLAGTLPSGYVRIPFGFAGGLFDPDTGLVRFGARDYDASVGRFVLKDPIKFDGGSLNLYGYVVNDPVNLMDPDGLKSFPQDCSSACYAQSRLLAKEVLETCLDLFMQYEPVPHNINDLICQLAPQTAYCYSKYVTPKTATFLSSCLLSCR